MNVPRECLTVAVTQSVETPLVAMYVSAGLDTHWLLTMWLALVSRQILFLHFCLIFLHRDKPVVIVFVKLISNHSVFDLVGVRLTGVPLWCRFKTLLGKKSVQRKKKKYFKEIQLFVC